MNNHSSIPKPMGWPLAMQALDKWLQDRIHFNVTGEDRTQFERCREELRECLSHYGVSLEDIE